MTAEQYSRELSRRLLAARSSDGVWRGELSSSALSTAVGACALALSAEPADRARAAAGLRWLVDHANPDGGWGDTVKSPSNLSTTLLAWSALGSGARNTGGRAAAAAAETWLSSRVGDVTDPSCIVQAVLDHYGSDRTFSVPILTMCALAGRLGGPEGWRAIPQLPFELAVLPRALFRFIGLPVVSYALPALIAMGLVRHRHAGRWWHGAGLGGLRGHLVSPALSRLTGTQPSNGGFLEATPLTGFVAMSLLGAGLSEHAVVRNALGFLRAGQRADGSWPIDTDLATWLTSMSARTLAEDLGEGERNRLAEWLLDQQFTTPHPFTGAAPGGWGWTDLPGSVPDADDTSGVLVALHGLLGERRREVLGPIRSGLEWLLGLRNRDGGLPTFCRGWGRLPFDRSCPDITAHALEAFALWRPHVPAALARRLDLAEQCALAFLNDSRRDDGSWVPLWFGNEHAARHENPVYGTARVLVGLAHSAEARGTDVSAMAVGAVGFLRAAQHADGGWGGASGVAATVEETALAVRALASFDAGREAASRGLRWLIEHVEKLDDPAPIGLYFASLWYYERLYPLVFASAAARDCVRRGIEP